MLDFLFVASFVGFSVYIVLIFKFLRLSFFRITLPSMVILFMVAFAYIGILPLYFGWVRASGTIEEKLMYTVVFLCASGAIIGLTLGFSFSRSILGLRLQQSPLQCVPLKGREILGLILLLCVSLFVLYLYLAQIDRIALFVAIKEGFKEAQVARSGMGNDFQGKYHWYRLFFRQILYFLSFVFWSNWLLTKRVIDFSLFSLALGTASFASLMATEKAPFAWLLIGIIIVYYLTKKGGNISIKGVALVFSLLLIVVSLMYMVFMGSRNTVAAVFSLFSRVFSGQIAPAAFYVEVFPEQIEFLLGRTMPNPGGILPYVPFRYTVELMNMKFPHLKELGIVGSMPTAFWGEAYINFGFVGVLVLPIFIGAWVWFMAYLLDRMENTPLKIASITLLIFHFRGLAFTGFFKFIVDVDLASLLVIISFALFLGRFFFGSFYALKKLGASRVFRY